MGCSRCKWMVLFPVLVAIGLWLIIWLTIGKLEDQPFKRIEVNGVECDVGWQTGFGLNKNGEIKGHYIAICRGQSTNYL